MHKGWRIGVLTLLLPTGCGPASMTATGISQQSTVSLADMIGDIQERQALDNIAIAIDEPSAIPSQMTIKQGTGIGNLSLSPTFTTTNLRYGLGNGIKLASPTASTATGVPLQNLNLGMSVNQEAQFQVAPVVDANELHRIRDLYAMAAGHCTVDARADDLCTQKSFLDSGSMESGTYSANVAGPGISRDMAKALKNGLLQGISPKCRWYQNHYYPAGDISGSGYTIHPWLFWRRAALWDYADTRTAREKQNDNWMHGALNAKNVKDGKGNAITVAPLAGVYPDSVRATAHYEFAVALEGRACFDDFVLLTQALTPATNTAGDQSSPTGPQGSAHAAPQAVPAEEKPLMIPYAQ